MASNFDAEEFIDEDFRSGLTHASAAASASSPSSPTSDPKAPTRQEVESRVNEMQQKIASLKQAQSELERQRTTLDDLRRRQSEFDQGRQEMVHHLTRGVGLLEDAERHARREAEQMSKTLVEFRDALTKIQAIKEETWAKGTVEVELTRANTVIENARMEWNSALIKLPLLSEEPTRETQPPAAAAPLSVPALISQQTYAELCKLGLALTWPLVLAGLAIFIVLLIR